MPSSEDYWLTRPEVGERLRVPDKTLAQWATKGKGPKYARFGRHCRYKLSDVIDWETPNSAGAPPKWGARIPIRTPGAALDDLGLIEDDNTEDLRPQRRRPRGSSPEVFRTITATQ